MTFLLSWRIWFFVTVGVVAACLLGSVWAALPLSHFFPQSFNRFYVSYWWLSLLVGLSASSIVGLMLVLFDASFSWLSRLICTVVIAPFAPLQLPLIGYWLYRIERPRHLERRATTGTCQ